MTVIIGSKDEVTHSAKPRNLELFISIITKQ